MINKITIKKLLAVMAAGSLIAVSCTKNFEKINIHPADLDPDDMSSVEKVGTLLPAMIYLLQPQHENNSQMTDQLVYGQLGGYYSAPNMFNNHGGNGHQVANWNPQETMYRGPYIDFMSPFYSNYFRIVEETGGEGAVYVVANVIKVAVMHRIADTYGPIPYSKVGSGAFEVEYDALDVLYPKLLEDISAVISTLESYGSTPSPALAEYDIMFKGNFSKWLKYANSLKFRIAMRISSMDEA
ncbi:MAG: SusD/RagB family nutrient-binding outer membrane lipoprotein, partial [Bacteroidales bacterium]|nr:SusD/RagB family nutrient-binding outer membrane lipoprotein [Bacteroidales bacterium]